MAVRYRFTKNYDHPINSYTDKAYAAGTEALIPEAHAAGADAKGAGERIAEDKGGKAEKVQRSGADLG